jgi:hypothetical protein
MTLAATRDLAPTGKPPRLRPSRKVLLALFICLAPLQLLPPAAHAVSLAHRAHSTPPDFCTVVPNQRQATKFPSEEEEARAQLHIAHKMIPYSIHGGNLRIGLAGELLLSPLSVQAPEGTWIHFQTVHQGQFEESGSGDAWVVAEQDGIAQVHFRLGEERGRYIVAASPEGSVKRALIFELLALPPDDSPISELLTGSGDGC